MKKRIPFLVRMLKKLSKELDFKYALSGKKDVFGYIEFKNGVRHFISKFDIRINNIATYNIAGDKDYTDYFLKKFGYPIVRGDMFFKSETEDVKDVVDRAFSFAEKISFPVVIKPNTSAHGIGFQVIYKSSQFKKLFKESLLKYNKILVQEFIQGSDYRIIIYSGKYIAAYKRTPFTVIGDGILSILDLIEVKKRGSIKKHRRFDVDIDEVIKYLKQKKIKISSIPKKDEKIQVLQNANLSSGGSAIDVTNIIHIDYINKAISAVKDMGLNICGVDIMVENNISEKPKKGKWRVLEINASPGFDGFCSLGKKQHNLILKLFRKILSDIKNKKIKI